MTETLRIALGLAAGNGSRQPAPAVKPRPQTAEEENVTTALRSPPSAHVRELILEEVAEHPYVQQRELAALLHELTGLAESTLITLFQKLTRAGELEPGLDGRRRTYRLPMN